MEFEICRLSQADDEAALALWREAVEGLVASEQRGGYLIPIEELRRAVCDDRCYLYLALSLGRPVGLLNAFRFPDLEAGGQIVYLYDIEVAASSRKRGIGAALVRALVEQCRAEEVDLIWAGTDASNTPARKLFEATEAQLDGDAYVEYEWDLES